MLNVKWIDSMRFVARTDSGHAVMMDTKEAAGGQETAPSPMEMILAGLAGCTSMDTVSILKKMRQDVAGLEVDVHSERAEEHPKTYTKIELRYTVLGTELDEEKVRRAIELSQEKYCSVSAMLRPKVEITYSYEIKEGK